MRTEEELIRSASPSVIQISRAALIHNFGFFRKLASESGSRLFAVVKANAYGHGADLAVSVLNPIAGGFCVHSVEEALKIAQLSTKPILVMGHVPLDPECLETLLGRADIRFVVYDDGALQAIAAAGSRLGRAAPIYVKLETGTNRLGLRGPEAARLCDMIRKLPGVRLQGFSTHFANIEDTTDHSYAEKQHEEFIRLAGELSRGETVELHSACSAAALLFPRSRQSFIRLGIAMYGYWPSRETYVSFKMSPAFTENVIMPALTWKTRALQIKELEEGEYIGYGLTYQARARMRIAVLPIGYSDGFDRRLSNSGYVLIRGKRAPICGRICMNLTMVDVSHIECVTTEDDVILIGRSGSASISAEKLASLSGTIAYELLARLGQSIPRMLVD